SRWPSSTAPSSISKRTPTSTPPPLTPSLRSPCCSLLAASSFPRLSAGIRGRFAADCGGARLRAHRVLDGGLFVG
ncbi:unnamed protein product, partial [Phaeothamnion confervicola]